MIPTLVSDCNPQPRALLTTPVYHVLLHLRSTLTPGDFFHILDDSVSSNLTPAIKLLQVYARQDDRQLLRDFYYQDDRRTENACLEMEEAGSTAVSPSVMTDTDAVLISEPSREGRTFAQRCQSVRGTQRQSVRSEGVLLFYLIGFV